MGSSGSKHPRIMANEKLMSMKTADLKSRLNQLYRGIKSAKAGSRPDTSRFDYLWDLKELALMEGRQSIDVPETWLEEIEKGLNEQGGARGH